MRGFGILIVAFGLVAVGLCLMGAAILTTGHSTVVTVPDQTQSVAELREAVEYLADSKPGERIRELPAPTQGFTLTLFRHDDWQARDWERVVSAWWDNDAGIAELKAQCQPIVYTPSSPYYKEKLAASVPESTMPIILLQDQSGKIHWRANVYSMPRSAGELAGSLRNIFKDRKIYILPWRRDMNKNCPCPKPGPNPDDKKENTVVNTQIFPPAPAEKPAPPDNSGVLIAVLIGLAILTTLGGLGLGAVAGIKIRAQSA